ncbi:MAG: hypothetical protein PHU31_08580 [Anaerotignum sp.]|nr:hypothetical protein [Anaerotignum sp.]
MSFVGALAVWRKTLCIEYKIDQLVGGYEDCDGFNFQFINPGMGTLPTDVTVKITMQDGAKLDESNSGIWTFGFQGQIYFENGQVVAYTESPLSSSTDSVIIMLQLNKGLIHPIRIVDEAFEAVKAQAFNGSDYDTKDTGDVTSEAAEEDIGIVATILGWVIMVLPILGIILFVKRKGKSKKEIHTLYKNADYFREAPLRETLR